MNAHELLDLRNRNIGSRARRGGSVLALAAFLAFQGLGAQGIALQSAFARTTGSCLSENATTVYHPGDSAVLNAPDGELITAVSVKAGRKCFVTPEDATGTVTLDDCYVIEGLATAEATVRRIASRTCKPISNIQFVTAPAGEPEVCGDGFDNDRDGTVDDGCIGDRAWRDLNRNGIQEAGEPGLADIPFRLRTSDGTLVASTVSDANGIYYFSNVPAGTYFVETTQPPPFSLVPPNRGTDDTLDSDFGGLGHRTPDFAFPADGSINHVDAGFEIFLD